MKTTHKWIIAAGIVIVAGLLVNFGLNRGTQAEHFTAKVERGRSMTWWKQPEQSTQ